MRFSSYSENTMAYAPLKLGSFMLGWVYNVTLGDVSRAAKLAYVVTSLDFLKLRCVGLRLVVRLLQGFKVRL